MPREQPGRAAGPRHPHTRRLYKRGRPGGLVEPLAGARPGTVRRSSLALKAGRCSGPAREHRDPFVRPLPMRTWVAATFRLLRIRPYGFRRFVKTEGPVRGGGGGEGSPDPYVTLTRRAGLSSAPFPRPVRLGREAC